MIKAYDLLEEGKGILRLAPTWVPRSFCRPAKRIKLHPDDYYVLGLERGGIDERWLSSATPADNGPGTPEDEGLSYAVSRDGKSRTVGNSPAFYKFTWGMSVIKDKFILLHSLKFVNNFCARKNKFAWETA